LDVSMEETHVCVVDRDGKIILEARTPTAPQDNRRRLGERAVR
jgi:predicted NBD/HSP70 family sugar kinase